MDIAYVFVMGKMISSDTWLTVCIYMNGQLLCDLPSCDTLVFLNMSVRQDQMRGSDVLNISRAVNQSQAQGRS